MPATSAVALPVLANPFNAIGNPPISAAVSPNTAALSNNLLAAASEPSIADNLSSSLTSSKIKSDKVSTSSVATAASTAPAANICSLLNIAALLPALDTALATPKPGSPNCTMY